LGHAYGRLETKPDKEKTYRDLSGQLFWAEITGDEDFYLKLIRLMKDAPKRHREEYQPAWSAALNRLTKEFLSDFCFANGAIDWEKLTSFVSKK
jgi:hypothetical protein